MRAVAVVPARGGSRDLTCKALLSLGGRTLLDRAVGCARAARRIDAVYVSTDDPEIAAAAEAAGAGVIERPAELRLPGSSVESVLLHALELIEAEGEPVDALVLLDFAYPFTNPADIDACVDAIGRDGAFCAFTAVPDRGFLWRVGPDGAAIGVNHDALRRRREEQGAFRETGAAYAMAATAFRATGSRFCGKATLVPVTGFSFELGEPADLAPAAALLAAGAGEPRAAIPANLKALVMDFDGVFTDDRVLVDENGREAVFASRSDGMGLNRLQKLTALKLLILSKEPNPVVSARARKLKIEALQGIDDKLPELDRWLARHGVTRGETAYIGNDVNDLACMEAVGFPVAPADARPEALAVAAYVTKAKGGRGALRELCEALICALGK